MTMRFKTGCVILLWTLLASAPALAQIKIAILDFELNDLTLQPDNPAERERTASVAPMLRAALAQQTDYQIITISAEAQAQADIGFGYLFDHEAKAAALAAEHGADWILVGRLHKPSFLFAYLMGRLVRVESGELTGDYLVEIKGPTRKLTQRGADNLAERIIHTLSKQAGSQKE